MPNWFVRKVLGFISPTPGVLGIISKGNKVLLTRRNKGLIEGGKWCVPGGHLSRWETAEAGVKREIKEELGLESIRAKFLFYHDELVSRLNLHAIVLVYQISVIGNIKPNWEVSEYRWFSRNEIQDMDIAFDHKSMLNKFFKLKK